MEHAALKRWYDQVSKRPMMLTGPYAENGAWQEWLLVRPEHLALAPPTVERVYPFGQASEALRHLIEDRPFGKIVLAG
jgi:hypothetical protein